VIDPHSYGKDYEFYSLQNFYNEVRDYDASLEPWLRNEYRNLSDAEQAFNEYKSKKQKLSLWARLKTSLTFPLFTMGEVTNRSIEEYLSKSRDHYDLEQRERKIMLSIKNRQVGFA
tara:strand:+ start:51 stop:398 length:348 start_codon:yes stop_codon:yes gene_type:complete